MFWTKRYGSLSDALANPRKVKILELHRTGLDCDINRVGELRHVHEVRIGWLDIEDLPSGILNMPNLKKLTVLNSPIKELPCWIGKLKKLKTLVVRGTDIKELPSSLSKLNGLSTLNVGNNPLISSLPTNIGDLSKLRTLNLHCTSVGELPESLENLKRLRLLQLTGTKFSGDQRLALQFKLQAKISPYLEVT
ncbi:leucine-rich repeat domain-containing protein [Vibrio profundum]|uniref:leucine-rich repeat domain-containing protein n=1 Tax=Vibrio profundum TaxID=2910247 RepID=UPI003D0BD7C3